MRILVLHAWLKGNLGDVLQLSVLLAALRELNPRALDLAGYPPDPAPETNEVLRLADRYVADPFPWQWALVPSFGRKLMFEPRWRKKRRVFFSGYDALVLAPGPYLADYDPRAMSALCDIDVAAELGIPVVLASHSIGPLGREGVATVARSTVRVAREPATHQYLRERGVEAVPAADLAFLYRYAGGEGRTKIQPPYRLLFLRSNNLSPSHLRLEDGRVFERSRLIVDAAREPLVLATSDRRRDARFLARAARALRVRSVACGSVAEMVALIEASSGVVSDRYHPAICAAVLGKPAMVLPNREPHKMQGLKDLLAESSVEELQGLARAGLRTVVDTLRSR